MLDVIKKLNYKDQPALALIEAPEDISLAFKAALPDARVIEDLSQCDGIHFALAFVTRQEQVNALAPVLAQKLEGDALLWLCYPKGSSKRYRCDFNRDTGWTILGQLGFEPVRQIAIDEDWSALRFRRAVYIKKMTRSFAMTELGKEKTAQKK